MEVLETLAVALGLASLAGVNLYLTVLITGLAVNQQWIDLSDKYSDLLVLGEPAVLIAAGTFTVLEFCSDKIPWVDSFWDSMHTLIRPVGGGALALTALGPTDPAFAVIVGMLAGGTSLMTHGLKSGTRLAINSSPEPVSNMTASLTEDMAVVGGLALMSVNPFLFAGICGIFLILAAYMAPKLFRRFKAFTFLLWNKISSALRRRPSVEDLTLPVSVEDEIALVRFCNGEEKPDVKWSVPVLVGGRRKFSQLTVHTFGRIYALHSDSGAIHFIGKKNRKLYHGRIGLEDLEVVHESGFLTEDVVLENEAPGCWLQLRLYGASPEIAKKVVTELNFARNQFAAPILTDSDAQKPHPTMISQT